LNDVAVALVVVDSRNQLDPLAGVQHWIRALKQAEKVRGTAVSKTCNILVANREDVGPLGVSDARLTAFVKEHGFGGYVRTSAREGWGIEELRKAIRDAINWDLLPAGSSTEEFSSIKHFLLQEKQEGHLLSAVDELYMRYLNKNRLNDSSLRPNFETCIRLLESRDLIHRLSFGNFLLLQPELLDIYAAAIVNAAKTEPEGLGCISEDAVRTVSFRMPSHDRLKNSDVERLLVIATTEELLQHEIALREGGLLIFPTQLTREKPDRSQPVETEMVYQFDGPILNIYATLVVRLSHSSVFEREDMWMNCVEFSVHGGLGRCGLFLKYIQEGRAELTLFFAPDTTIQSRYHFDDYVRTHLSRWALPDSLIRRRVFRCPNEQCKEELSASQISRRRQLGHTSLRCPVCETEVSILEWQERIRSIQGTSLIPVIDNAADQQRDKNTADTVLLGKRAVGQFDVFLCHNSKDKDAVKRIGRQLQAKGLLPWLDEWELAPGVSWQPELEKVMDRIGSAAVFVGPNGIGPWQEEEVQAFLRKFTNSGRPVIPVLLPKPTAQRGSRRVKGSSRGQVRHAPQLVPGDLPKLPILLESRTWVDFTRKEPDPLDRLIWGITGTKPK